MSRVIAFHIENTREDYAKAFRWITQKNIGELPWAKEHIYSAQIRDVSGKNFYRNAICLYEKNENKKPFFEKPTPEDILYFRVKNNKRNDITNLHYFYLASRYLESCRLCIGVIQGDEKKVVEAGIISSYLLFETLNRNPRNEFQIVKQIEGGIHELEDKSAYNAKNEQKDKSKNHTKDFVELLPSSKENIFLIRKMKNGNESNDLWYPYRINKRRLTVSHKFFPQLVINEKYLRILGATSVEKSEGEWFI